MAAKPKKDGYYEDGKRLSPWWRRLLAGLGPATPPRNRQRSAGSYRHPALDTFRVLGIFLHALGNLARRIFFAGLYVVQVSAIFCRLAVIFCLTGWKSRHLAASLPALLVVLLVGGLALARSLSSNAELLQHYIQAADAAVRTRDYAAARTYFQKALLLGDRRPEVRYSLALCQEQLGQHTAAQALLAPLTEDGPGGYAPALLHNGRRLLAEVKPSPAALQKATLQLEQAVARQPELIEAQLLLGNLYWSAGRLSEAEATLLRLAKEKPSVQLMLVNLCIARGDVAGATSHALLARDFFLPQVQTGQADDAAVLGCSQAYLTLEDYPAAVKTLSEAIARRDSPALRTSLAGAFAAWADSEKKARPAELEVRLRLLEAGLRHAPNDARLLKSLFELSKLPGAEAAKARATLEKMLVQGPPSAVLHLLLGLDDWQQGKQETGRLHLEQAYRLAPDVGLVINNLAAMVAEGPRPDLTRALALADVAVQRWPEEVHYRDTRGQILVKLKRYQDALADLEAAQQGMPDNAGLHAALAKTYEGLGMTSLAEGHRRQAERKPATK